MAVAAVTIGALATVTGPTVPAGAVAAPGTFTAVSPARILDTRTGVGAPRSAVPGRGTIALTVAGRGGVPLTGAGAVALNVTVVAPLAGGYLTVWPHGTPRPGVSAINFVAGQTVANSVTVMLPAAGSLDIYNGSAGSVQVLADVSGYFGGGATTAAGGFVPVRPARVLDTRSGTGGTVGPVGPQGMVSLHIAGAGGVPLSGVSAVVLNLTAVAPTAAGSLIGWDGGPVASTTPSLSFVAGRNVANQAIIPLGPTGYIGIRNASAGTVGNVQIIADVAGYYLAGSPQTAGAFQVLPAARILDTSTLNNATSRVLAGGTLNVFVAEAGVPLSGVDAVALHVTLSNAATSGYLTVFASGTTRPGTSNLNWGANQSVGNLVLAQVGTDGRVAFANSSGSAVDVAADVVGYVRGAAPAPLATIGTYAGAGQCSASDPQHPCLTAPTQVALDAAGDVYIADGVAGLREVTPDGVVHTVVPGPLSTRICASTGDGGPASAGCVNASGVMRPESGDLYISDAVNARLRKVAPDGVISTVAGNGTGTFCGDGGPATQACLAPVAARFDASGRLYIADPSNNNVRRVELDGTITRVAGKAPPVEGGPVFCVAPDDGLPATQVCLARPWDLAFDSAGNLYIAEFNGYRLRKVDLSGAIRTVAGNGWNAFCGDGGPATAACLARPAGIAFDQAGNLLVSADGRIRRIDPAGTITTMAGHGLPITFCGDGGSAPAACLSPRGLAVDAAGRTYVADSFNRRIWLLTG
jgi:sugar lactone lactonase YvrE